MALEKAGLQVRFGHLRPLLLAAATLLASCDYTDDQPIAPPPTDLELALEVVSGNNQVGVVGSELPQPLVVRVMEEGGSPRPEQMLEFRVLAGGGTVSDGSSLSDNNGMVSEHWTIGTQAGTSQRLEVRAVDQGSGDVLASAVITAVAAAGPPARIALNAGDDQTDTVGTAVAIPPAVRLTDEYGNAKSGVSVQFTVASGGGSVSGGNATSNNEGIARVGSWTLGPEAGPNRLTARATGSGIEGNPVTFTATAVAAPPPPPPPVGPPAHIVVHAGADQTATVGTPVPIAPAVLLTDEHGQPVPNVAVTFVVISGGGSVTGASVTSDTLGIATVGSWTLGAEPGTNRLTAIAVALGVEGNPVTFSATAVAAPPPPAPAGIAVQAGDGQSATAGTAVAIPPAVRVIDQFGNPMGGVAVTFAVASGGGSVSGASTTSNGDGVATVGSWTLGPQEGPNTLTATAAGTAIEGNPVTFSATAVAPPPPPPALVPTSIVIHAGDNQTAQVGTAVPIAPAVLVTDQDGKPMANVTVTFAVASGGGSVTGENATTNADGIATVGSWILGPTAGTNTLTATATGSGIAGNPVAFTATTF